MLLLIYCACQRQVYLHVVFFQGNLKDKEDEDDEDDEDLGYSDTYAEYWPSKCTSYSSFIKISASF